MLRAGQILTELVTTWDCNWFYSWHTLCGHILIGDDIHKINNFEFVGRFEVFTVVSNRTAAFWNELPWSLADVCWCVMHWP